jgi:hypothetical protein
MKQHPKMNDVRRNNLGLIALALAIAPISNSSGYTVALSQGSYQNGIGGEFKATVSDDSIDGYLSGYALGAGNAATNTFQTFCIEYREHFNWNVPYTGAVSGAAIKGGTLTQDAVSVGTGWLYSQFAQGLLATNNYFTGSAANRTAQAGLLQNAIWWLEGEITNSQANNPFILAAEVGLGIAHGSTFPNASPGQEGTGLALNTYNGQTAASFGVFALNLGPFQGNPNVITQDQLIYQRTSNRNVPDGGTTLVLLGLSLTGMRLLQRRMCKIA